MQLSSQTQYSGLAEKCEQRTNVSHIPFLTGSPSKSELQTDGYSQLKHGMDSHRLGFLMMCSGHIGSVCTGVPSVQECAHTETKTV